MYARDRVETERVVLSTEVYDHRKEEYTKRINAMLEYVANSRVCRSRQLLRYLGEKNDHDCHICDVCRG